MTETIRPRDLRERQAAATAMLRDRDQLWLATSGDGAHLIPVSYVWDGTHLTMATAERSRAAANLRSDHRARAAIGTTEDVVMIDGTVSFVAVADLDQALADRYARVSHDPRVLPGYLYLRLAPRRIQVWNGFHENRGRTAMLDGRWLDDPN